MLDQTYYDKTDEIIAMHGAVSASLIPIIQDIQNEYRYLAPELLAYVADKLGISEAKAIGNQRGESLQCRYILREFFV